MGVGLMIGSAIAFRALSLSFFRLLFSLSRRLSIFAFSFLNSALGKSYMGLGLTVPCPRQRGDTGCLLSVPLLNIWKAK